jgi:NhaA family Na+:H+ antiporter
MAGATSSTPATSAAPVPRLILAVVRPFREFFRTQAAGGVVLVAATIVALVWANSRYAHSYEGLLRTPVEVGFDGRGLAWPLHHWINDALMSVFFLVAGMEIKRELVVGELRTLGRAALPAVAALGGMVVPAGLHLALNHGGPASHGWGIPMATDIAFALGCMALVSRRVPTSLVVFLMALAIFDDLGAILVIAIFYGGQIDTGALAVAGALTGALAVLSWLRVVRVLPYLLVGLFLWVAVLRSGIHATVAGVVLGLTIPSRGAMPPGAVLSDLELAVARLGRTRDRELEAAGHIASIERHLESVQSPLDRMIHGLHGWVAFGIVPLFAIANAGVDLGHDVGAALLSPAGLGVFLGLFLGKPIGVFGATYLAVRAGLAPKPSGATWPQIFGVGVVAGIGFTMSIFVATLAFPGHDELVSASKLGIFAASLASALLGLALLARTGRALPSSSTAADLEVFVDLPRFAEGFRVEPWVAHGPFVGKTLRDLDVRRRWSVSVIGVHGGGRASSAGLEMVGADTEIEPGATLVLVGRRDDVDAFLAAAEPQPASSESERPPPPGEA